MNAIPSAIRVGGCKPVGYRSGSGQDPSRLRLAMVFLSTGLAGLLWFAPWVVLCPAPSCKAKHVHPLVWKSFAEANAAAICGDVCGFSAGITSGICD